MAVVGPQVAISLRADYAGGRHERRAFQPEARNRMLDHLARWATALRVLRLRTTSSQGQSRPALDDPSTRAAATSAVEQLVAGFQDGVDRACADVYDWQFASDVLWGSPYGATVSGYEALNAAHRSLMAAGAAPPSRYQIVQLMSPLPGVAIAHVRRNDLSDGKGQAVLGNGHVRACRTRRAVAAGRRPEHARRRAPSMTGDPGQRDGSVPADPPRDPGPVCPRSSRGWPGLWPMRPVSPRAPGYHSRPHTPAPDRRPQHPPAPAGLARPGHRS
jgi:hypothetical protein